MAKTKDCIHKSQEPHRVKCVLTTDEKAEAAMQLANAYTEKESLAIEKKTAMTEYKQRKEKIEEQIHVTSLKVREGVEMRTVKCELRLNYSTGDAVLVRLDTGVIVEEREMTADEKQMKLEFEKTAKKPNQAPKDKNSMKDQVEKEELNFEKKTSKKPNQPTQADLKAAEKKEFAKKKN